MRWLTIGVSSSAVHDDESTDLPEQYRVRRDKRDRLLAAGRDVYPVSVPVTRTIAQVRQDYAHLEAGQETEDVVGVAGRVMRVRLGGKLCFVTLQDGQGNELQGMLSLAEVGEPSLESFKTDVDLGDHLFLRGRVISSRRGELSVMADDWQLAAKALRPLPKTYETDAGKTFLSEETRVRQRYLDLITRPEARDMVRVRSAVVRSIRSELDERGFTEVETPILQTQHGGAAARPFVTHINAYDIDLYLRIAPELFLKRAVVGGIERVFELNRIFRNEGADSTHSPEFAMLEAYQAYGDYLSIAELTRDLIQASAIAAFGTTEVTLADGTRYDLGGDWARLDLYEATSRAAGTEISPETPLSELLALADSAGLTIDPRHVIAGKVAELLFDHFVGDHLWEPTFIMHYPVDTSPLVRAHRSRPGVVEKWDLNVRGVETATGYSELVDPVIQRERFEAQALLAAKGDEEAMRVDEEFLEAMEHGMPPMGGMGMGLDRLLMALTGYGIRDTILFPLVKPR